jgi:hypothetical protein
MCPSTVSSYKASWLGPVQVIQKRFEKVHLDIMKEIYVSLGTTFDPSLKYAGQAV